jgi:hypothetical protein
MSRVDASSSSAEGSPATSSHSTSTSCWGRFCAGVRHLAFLVAVITAAGAVGWIWLENRLNDEIRTSMESRFQQRLKNSPLSVSIRSARRIDGPDPRDQGIEVRGLEVRDKRTDEVVAAVDEMWLACTCGLQDLLNQRVVVRHITMRRPRISIAGSWKTWEGWDRWFTTPEPTGEPWPTVVVEEGTLEWTYGPAGRRSPVTMRGVNLVVRPASGDDRRSLGWPTGENSRLESPKSGGEKAAQRESLVHVKLAAAGDMLEKLEADLLWDRMGGDWRARGRTAGLRVARDLIGLLPEDWSSQIPGWKTIEARGELAFEAHSPEAADQPPAFTVTGEFQEGQWSDPRVPSPVTNLELSFVANNSGLEIRRLAGRCGLAEMSGTLRAEGWRSGGEVDATLRLRRFDLNRAWVDLLPAELRSHWEKFAIHGEFDVDLEGHYDGREWSPCGVVVGRRMSAQPHWFRYPLADGFGRAEFQGGRVRSQDVVFTTQGKPILVEFDIANPGPKFTGYVAVKTPEGVAIDAQLIGALPGAAADFARSLQPRGEVVIDGRIERHAPESPFARRADLTFRRGSLQFTRFSYPVEKIEGKVKMVDDVWEIGELTGRNDVAYIVARGVWNKLEPVNALKLDIEAYDVALEEELRTALSPTMQRLWAQFQPRGTIDYVAMGLKYPDEQRGLALDITLQKNPPSQNVEGRNVTIRPQNFPYPFDNVTGTLRYVNGQLEIESLRAEHARSVFRARGRGRVEPTGRWQIQLGEFAVDRLQVDHDLASSLPASAAAILAKANWTGMLGVDGRLSVQGGAGPGELMQASWDVRVDVENGNLALVTPVEQIRGSTQLVGAWNGREWSSAAELALDSLFIRGVHLTRLQGPVMLSPTQIIVGDTWLANRPQERVPRPVTAKLFDGQASADAVLYLGEDVGFRFQAGIQNASLQEVARELATSRRDMLGRAFATLQMEGTTRGPHTWRGLGKVTCRDTSIEQLPVMNAIVKANEQKRTESSLALSDVDFSIQGDRVYFDRIDLKGEAMTLKGSGEMTLNRIVDLQFYTLMGRDDFWVPVVSPVLAEASKQMLEIRVKGPLESPVIDRKVVPAINDAVRQMFPELANGDETPLVNRIPTPRQIMQRGIQPIR